MNDLSILPFQTFLRYPLSKFIYSLTYILLKASITRGQINEAPSIVVEPMIYLKVYLFITTINKSVSRML